MRWVNKGLVSMLVVMGLGNVGCTAAVLEAGANDPRAFAALPVAMIGDLIAAAAGDSSSSSSAATPVPDPSLASWEDPDDWVAECAGPAICRAPQSFVCYGEPGDCYCACSMMVAGTSSIAATTSPQ